MSRIYYDLMASDQRFNYRWVQPPQVTYLVSTVDRNGNHNITPVTLGTCVGVNSLPDATSSNYYYAFSVGSADVPDIPARHAHRNLQAVPECVISYPGPALVEKIWAAALPLPAGVEEMAVARLTPLPSGAVRPAGIAECPINLEARVTFSHPVGDHYTLYVCQIVAVSVDRALVEGDEADPLRRGVLGIDPLFETAIAREEDRPPRLYFGRIDQGGLTRTPDDMGSRRVWTGSFEAWMEDEAARGKITAAERAEILGLAQAWEANPDPAANGQTKETLQRRLAEVVWDRR